MWFFIFVLCIGFIVFSVIKYIGILIGVWGVNISSIGMVGIGVKVFVFVY